MVDSISYLAKNYRDRSHYMMILKFQKDILADQIKSSAVIPMAGLS